MTASAATSSTPAAPSWVAAVLADLAAGDPASVAGTRVGAFDELGGVDVGLDGGKVQAASGISPSGVAGSRQSEQFLYAGQYRDAESGLYYLRARYYHPSTTQFLSRDPLASMTGEPYGYANDNPLNGSDASGLMGCPSGAPGDPYHGHPPSNPYPWITPTSGNKCGDTPGGCNQFCTVWNGPSCQPFISTAGICISGSIFGGIGVRGSACFVSSHGQLGVTATAGYGSGLGGGVSVGPSISDSPCIQDMGGPFAEAGGGGGPLAGSVAVRQGSRGKVSVGYFGLGPGTPEGYVAGTNTWTWTP